MLPSAFLLFSESTNEDIFVSDGMHAMIRELIPLNFELPSVRKLPLIYGQR